MWKHVCDRALQEVIYSIAGAAGLSASLTERKNKGFNAGLYWFLFSWHMGGDS